MFLQQPKTPCLGEPLVIFFHFSGSFFDTFASSERKKDGCMQHSSDEVEGFAWCGRAVNQQACCVNASLTLSRPPLFTAAAGAVQESPACFCVLSCLVSSCLGTLSDVIAFESVWVCICFSVQASLSKCVSSVVWIIEKAYCVCCIPFKKEASWIA